MTDANPFGILLLLAAASPLACLYYPRVIATIRNYLAEPTNPFLADLINGADQRANDRDAAAEAMRGAR